MSHSVVNAYRLVRVEPTCSLNDFLFNRENVMCCLHDVAARARGSGFSECRFKDGDVLLDAATTHADARDQLALVGEWGSAAH